MDLVLNPERLTGVRYANLLDALKRKGYLPGEKLFQLFKEITVGRKKVRVDVEFLAPKGVKMKKDRPRRVPGFRVLEAEGCALAFDDPAIVIIEGKMPDERRNRVSIRVASVTDFLVMKGFALAGRDKLKDAYDIYFYVKNYPGGPMAFTQKLVAQASCQLLFLPAYSPDLNPIEHLRAAFKIRLRKDLPTATNPFLFIANISQCYC